MRLAATADVFVQNFRPGVAERIGVGEDAIRAVKPDIVYVSISGFGEKGPYAQKPVYDPLIQGFSGLATVQAGSDEARPRMLRTILPDKLTAITASQAITAALLARERTGEGQHVRLSMLEAVLAFLWASDMAGQTFVGDEPARQEAASSTDLIYETADGYITVAVQTNRQWEGLTRALDRPEWLDDPRFKTPALRAENVEARLQMTQDVLIGGKSAEWLDRLTKADVPCAPGADPQRGDPPSACRGAGNCRGIRSPRGRTAAPGAGRGALLGDPDRDPPRRAGARRAHRRGARRTRLFGRADRRAAGGRRGGLSAGWPRQRGDRSWRRSDTVFAGSIPALYDRYLGPLIFEPYAADLAARVASGPAERVLETAAGTGILDARAGGLAARRGRDRRDRSQPADARFRGGNAGRRARAMAAG